MARRASDATVFSLQEMRRAEGQILTTLDLVEQIQVQNHTIIDELAYRLSRQTEALLSEVSGSFASGDVAPENRPSGFPDMLLSAINLNDIRLSLDTLINIINSQGLQNQLLQLEAAQLLAQPLEQ